VQSSTGCSLFQAWSDSSQSKSSFDASQNAKPRALLPRNGSITLGGFNAFTEAEGDYH
jgi:hypothetical protein